MSIGGTPKDKKGRRVNKEHPFATEIEENLRRVTMVFGILVHQHEEAPLNPRQQ